jgi:RNA polymerase sigma factor (sigma-70 family)
VRGRSPDVSGSFADRFEDLYGVAYRAAYTVCGNRPEAEDCAQESLARALVRWSRIEGYATAWVARVSINIAIDRARSQRRHNGSSNGFVARTSEHELAERRQDLAAALQSLPNRQREAVVLRHVVGLPEAETAVAMGCSVGTVKSTTARALARMRDGLGQQWAWDD